MKRLIMLVIGVLLVIFIFIKVTVDSNYKYQDNIENDVLKNYEVDGDIVYSNWFDNYYIIRTNNRVIVLDNGYNLIFSEDVSNLFMLDYDIVYRLNRVMYMKSDINNDSVKYTYYDIYTGNVI